MVARWALPAVARALRSPATIAGESGRTRPHSRAPESSISATYRGAGVHDSHVPSDLGDRAAQTRPRRLPLARRGARTGARGATAEDGGWLAPTAGGAATGRRHRAERSDLDAVTTDGALVSKDYHSSGSIRQSLALADGSSRSRAASSSGRGGEPTGVLREESAWHVQGAVHDHLRRRVRGRDAGGVSLRCPAGSRPSTTGRLARRPRLWQRLADQGSLGLRSGSRSRTEARRARRGRAALGRRRHHLRIGYLKVFMDGTLGSQTACC